ncbi:hypothetical protein SmJEL517_g05610 [Synchytrium microbalum]|uniref:F-box domain-containing protein n=1 Tax=Synchytrium microbalum TaxID=1806994 RepID=A0A507BUN4_9FUNG|nr:uncharacterized protein SmJEL517_g05610 [Synchytrium microbalum]TPX30921.1 hypothetical protein SmJEL517_g05610 [Synchytrium microbalum]
MDALKRIITKIRTSFSERTKSGRSSPRSTISSGSKSFASLQSWRSESTLYTSAAVSLKGEESNLVYSPVTSMLSARNTLERPINRTNNSFSPLLDLPVELIITISHQAGFHESMTLALCCKRLNEILMDTRSWYAYTATTPDIIESRINIVTKLSTFDHLLFGVWPKAPLYTVEEEPQDIPMSSSNSSLSTLVAVSPAEKARKKDHINLFFEHRAFSDRFSFLGGVEFDVKDNGRVSSDFFEHLESKPCQQLEPTSPTSNAPLAITEHICNECYSYHHRKILRNYFVFDSHDLQDVSKPAFEWTWESINKKRIVKISVVPQRGVLGYASARNMPYILSEAVTINGKQLLGGLRRHYERLVGHLDSHNSRVVTM